MIKTVRKLGVGSGWCARNNSLKHMLLQVQNVSMRYYHGLLTGKSQFYKSECLRKANIDNRE